MVTRMATSGQTSVRCTHAGTLMQFTSGLSTTPFHGPMMSKGGGLNTECILKRGFIASTSILTFNNHIPASFEMTMQNATATPARRNIPANGTWIEVAKGGFLEHYI